MVFRHFKWTISIVLEILKADDPYQSILVDKEQWSLEKLISNRIQKAKAIVTFQIQIVFIAMCTNYTANIIM